MKTYGGAELLPHNSWPRHQREVNGSISNMLNCQKVPVKDYDKETQ
jgi:hypothetical protein